MSSITRSLVSMLTECVLGDGEKVEVLECGDHEGVLREKD